MSDTKPDNLDRSLKAAYLAYLQPKMLAMLGLGFASGLPLMMYFSKMSRWLAEVGIDKATIGFFFWIGFAYTLKFAWAPVVDRFRLPILSRLGQRRSWMALAIMGTIAAMLIISTGDPSPDVAGSLKPLIIGGLLLTYSGATLDISIDAWRIESGEADEQANLAAVYQLGYRFAIMAAGGAMIFADGAAGWSGAYKLTAALMAVCLIIVLIIREPSGRPIVPTDRAFSETVRLYVFEPFADFVRRLGVWVIPVLALVCLYRLSDFTMGVMTQPLYEELGYTKTEVGLITGVFGPWPLIAGAFIAGIFCVRFGLLKSLLIGAILTVITNGAFVWLALQNDPTNWSLGTVIIADNMAGGFVGTAFIAYLSSLVDRQYAATQYALLSSGYALISKTIAGFSGVVYVAVGAPTFFLITALYGLPAIALILYLWRYGPAISRGEPAASA